MKRFNFIRFIFVGVLILAPRQQIGWAEENSCINCHSNYWDEMKESVHSKNGITCNKCHGGDPTQVDQAMAKAEGTGYVGVPDKKQIAHICGECHANVEVMNFYGIPTDQLARYKTSHHGKKLLEEGDPKVAVCSDCHSYHDVVKVTDPSSPVYPLNLPNTCNRCHGNEKIMGHYNLPTDIFDKYKNSVHGVALFEKNDLSVANCASCHGSHGAVPPGVKEISATCGKCHINEKKFFSESVHAGLVEQGKFPECVACHGNHDVKPVSLEMYNSMCLKCHAKDDAAMKEGHIVLSMLKKSEAEITAAGEIVKQSGREGLFVEDEETALEEAHSKMVQMKPLQHTLSSERIKELYDQMEGKVTFIKTSIEKKRQSLQWRKVALIFIWIFIVLFSWVLWLRYQWHKKQR